MTAAAFTYEGVPVRIVFALGARHGLARELDRLGLSQIGSTAYDNTLLPTWWPR